MFHNKTPFIPRPPFSSTGEMRVALHATLGLQLPVDAPSARMHGAVETLLWEIAKPQDARLICDIAQAIGYIIHDTESKLPWSTYENFASVSIAEYEKLCDFFDGVENAAEICRVSLLRNGLYSHCCPHTSKVMFAQSPRAFGFADTYPVHFDHDTLSDYLLGSGD